MKVTQREHRYGVQSRTADLGSFYRSMFKDHALCRATGAQADGCENAVAMTSWRFTFDENLYDAMGLKRPTSASCSIEMTLPEWKNGKAAKRSQREEVGRFVAATTTHERGHGVACKSLSDIASRLALHLPAKVPASAAGSMNAAFKQFVEGFYMKLARRADGLFDTYTGHGGKYGAELAATLKPFGLGDLSVHFEKTAHQL